ncbi:MAG TPA: Flp family type IVb pilin [Terriglobia bacterium]|nr:Flp family type IVb pilin [Terriglobia bacterium]
MADFLWHLECFIERGLRMARGVINILTDVGGVPMKSFLTRLWQEEQGQDLTEYGLLLVLVALAAITSMSTLANAIKTVFSTAAANLSTS